MMLLQYIIIGVVIVVSLLYILKMTKDVISRRNDPCHGCKGCSLKNNTKHCQMKNTNGKNKENNM